MTRVKDHHHSLCLASGSLPNPKTWARRRRQGSVESIEKGFTLGRRGLYFVSQVEDSVARVKSSEEDVYYRNDPMKSVAQGQLVSLVISLGEERKGKESYSRH